MRILLLAGGDSREREVSLSSGKAVADSLSRLGHKVFAVDPVSGKSLLANDGSFIDFESSKAGEITINSYIDIRAVSNTISSPGFQDVNVVFLLLHGGLGENGTIQSLLDLANKKYTGSNMLASAVAMDKALTKRLCESENVPTPPWHRYHIRGEEEARSKVAEILSHHKLPIIVKPNDGGSTIGLTKVDREDQMEQALLDASRESHDVLVEDYITGRELTVSVLDGEALPVVEIIPKSGLYDYEAKYTVGSSEYIAPAKISTELAKQLQEASLKVYRTVGAWGLARVDFMLCEKNDYYCLEINTIPGMTKLSLSPMAAKAAGLDFDQLIERMLQSALDR